MHSFKKVNSIVDGYLFTSLDEIVKPHRAEQESPPHAKKSRKDLYEK